MKRFIIDRIEGNFAVCEDEEMNICVFKLAALPNGYHPGSVLRLADNGELSLDMEEEKLKRQKILEKQKKLFGS